jgi:hypothetical protein
MPRPCRRSSSRHGAAAIAVAAFTSLTSPARADDVVAARAAYAEGTRAYDAGDPSTAAEHFARADRLAPNPAALEAALRAALRADDPVLGMDLVRRAKGREIEGTAAELVEQARAEFQQRVGKLVIVCAPCRSITLDGKPAETGRMRWVGSGPHLVELDWGEGSERRLVTVAAGKTVRFTPSRDERAADAAVGDEAPSAEAPAKPRSTATTTPHAPPPIRGLSTGWFWATAAVGGALGAAAIASAVDTADRHEAYVAAPTLQAAADGKAAQTRTHVLLGFTGAAAVSAAVMGIVAVRWRDPAPPPGQLTGSVQPARGGATATLRGRF